MNTSTSAHGATGGWVRNRGPLQLGRRLVQAHRGRDHLVVARLRGARDEGVRPPARRPHSGRRWTAPAGPAAPRRRTASRAPSPTTRRGRGRRPSTARPRRSASRPPSRRPSGLGCSRSTPNAASTCSGGRSSVTASGYRRRKPETLR